MLTVEEALAKILGEIAPLGTENVPLLEAQGQVLAEDIISGVNVPPLDNSAMDGFAVRYEDTLGASRLSPKKLTVIDTVMAGSISEKTVAPGTAVRIMTGAPVPSGATAVVQFEDTDDAERRQTGQPDNEVNVYEPAKDGLNIRRAGESVAEGETVLRAGATIRPSEIGVIASVGRKEIKVIRRPIVAVLSTGDELVEIGEPLPAGKIYDSNLYSIASLVQRTGCFAKVLGIAEDNEESLVEKLEQARDADLLLTTGGVSMGDYDLVKDILDRDGTMVFWKVRVKPGKPLAFGKIQGTDGRLIPHLGLPGNAVSCMVSFELFVRPALLKMMGKENVDKPTVDAILEEDVKNNAGRRVYDRAVITRRNGSYYARLTGPQGSGVLTSMTQANGLVLIPEENPKLSKGETVKALMLDWNESYNI